MVDVITHRPELAERMPDRARVLNSRVGGSVAAD